MMARTGRRPGRSGTRDAILVAARESFTASGYDQASIRDIARRAGVDPALVHHYFGTKQKLFTEAVELPVDLVAVVEAFVRGDRDRIGERIVGLMLSVWDSRTDRSPLIALIRSAVTSENAARMLREFMVSVLFVRLAEALRAPDAPLRASLAASQMMGLLIARYVVRVEPLASAPAAQLVAAIGPNIQRYLTGDLGLG
ncbi:MAG TPA: TetR family transcriptional regulator [Actinomycetota bacterium]